MYLLETLMDSLTTYFVDLFVLKFIGDHSLGHTGTNDIPGIPGDVPSPEWIIDFSIHGAVIPNGTGYAQ